MVRWVLLVRKIVSEKVLWEDDVVVSFGLNMVL